MNNVKIIENLFEKHDIEKIKEYFKINTWDCNCLHRPNMNLKTDVPFWRDDLCEEIFFSKILKERIENVIKKKFALKRVYAVGQTFGQDSNFHTDDNMKNVYTLCLYINENVNSDSNGYFYIKIPNEKYIIYIEPILNRGVFFPANYRHKGTGYNITNSDFRICVAWKLIEIQ
jgi:hypothetical protein